MSDIMAWWISGERVASSTPGRSK